MLLQRYFNSFQPKSAGRSLKLSRMRILLPGALLVMVTAAHALSISCPEDGIIYDCGITSLLPRYHPSSGDVELFAGNNQGKMLHYFKPSDNQIQFLGEIQDEMFEPKPFPIFSMASTSDGDPPIQLFCGGGDRFISVWQLHEENKWTCPQRLGPHTGWVKDVLYDHRGDSLHSIGCNCIESWKRADGMEWTHAAKRSIQTSLEKGATLSSDLLCLCALDEADCFFAGGVDGRIHAWSCDTGVKDPLDSIRMHDGRINVMAFSRTARLFFSSGHDGTVQCRRDFQGSPLRTVADAQINIFDVNGKPARVTALALLEESCDYVQFMIGTANGELACFEAAVKKDTVVLTETTSQRFHLLDEPLINAICLLKSAEALGSQWPIIHLD